MIVRLSDAADAALSDLDRLDRLHAEVDGRLDNVHAADWFRVDDDGAHVWIDIDRCREMGRAERGDEWVAQYDAMIAYAGSKGWTDDTAHHVRAHIEPPATTTITSTTTTSTTTTSTTTTSTTTPVTTTDPSGA